MGDAAPQAEAYGPTMALRPPRLRVEANGAAMTHGSEALSWAR
jgi:hypothetical protein